MCSWPTDFAGSPSCTGSASSPRARSTSDAPCLPNRRIEDVRRQRGQVADRAYAEVGAGPPRSSRRRPTAAPIGSGARNAASSPGGDDDEPVGLAQVRRDLGHELGRRDTDRRGQPDIVADLVLDPAARSSRRRRTAPNEPVTSRNASSIEIGSTCGVNRRRTPSRRGSRAWYRRPSTGTKTPCGQRRPASRSDIAEWTPNRPAPRSSRPTTTPRSFGPPPPTMTGLPRSSGSVALLDRREERVEVDVEDRPVRHGRYHRATVVDLTADMLSVVASLALLGSMGALGHRPARAIRAVTSTRSSAGLRRAHSAWCVGTLALVPVATRRRASASSVVAVGASPAWSAAHPPDPPVADRSERSDLAQSQAPSCRASSSARSPCAGRSSGAMPSRRPPTGMFAGHVNIWGDWPVHLGIVSSFVVRRELPAGASALRRSRLRLSLPLRPHRRGPGHARDGAIAGALALHSYVGCVLVAIGLYAFARRLHAKSRGGDADRRPVPPRRRARLARTAARDRGVARHRRHARDARLGPTRQERPEHAVREHVLRVHGVAARVPLRPPARLRDPRRRCWSPCDGRTCRLVHRRRERSPVYCRWPTSGRCWPWRSSRPSCSCSSRRGPGSRSSGSGWPSPSRSSSPQLGGGAGALSAIRFQPGWVAVARPVAVVLDQEPRLVRAPADRRPAGPAAHAGARAAVPAGVHVLFVAANLAVFQPWDWDNHKLLVYWFLAVVDRGRGPARARLAHSPTSGHAALVAGVVVSMTLSGSLEDVGTAARAEPLPDAPAATRSTLAARGP